MLRFRKQKFLANGPNLLGLMLFAAGVLAFASIFFVQEASAYKSIWVGLGACFIGFILMTISSGIELDPNTYAFREYESILGFTGGAWEKLPPIQKMEMVKHAYTSQNTPNGVTPTFSSNYLIYKVAMISSGQVQLSLDFSQEKEAVDAMERLQGFINED